MNDPPREGQAAPAPAKRPRFRAGCAIVLCCLLLLAAIAAVGGYYIHSEVHRYTSAEPVEIPRHEPRPGEKEALAGRIREFEARGAPATLEISARDLNTLLVAAAGDAPPPVHARIEDGVVLIDTSIGLSRHPLLARFFGDRYLNATIGLGLEIVDGRLRGSVESAVAKNGERIGEGLLSLLGQEDFLGALLDEGKLLPAAGTATKVTVARRRIVLEK